MEEPEVDPTDEQPKRSKPLVMRRMIEIGHRRSPEDLLTCAVEIVVSGPSMDPINSSLIR